MKIGIIGSNGFVGQHLSQELSKVSNISLQLFGRSKISTIDSNLTYKQIDLLNADQLLIDIQYIDLIFYCASDSIPASSWENPFFEIENNLIPFINFLECAHKASIKKIVFISSAGTIYGESVQKLSENSDKKPFSPYGINKLTMENYLHYYDVKYGLKHDVFRVSNIYGEGQDTSKGLGVINTFLENIQSKKSIKVFGDGEQVRNYIYIKDVTQVLSNSIFKDITKSNIYNLTSDDNLSINEIITLIRQETSTDFKIEYVNSRGSDNPLIYIDNKKIKNDFPEIKFTSIRNGIKRSCQYLKNKHT